MNKEGFTSEDFAKLAFDDIRNRHKALFDLMLATDRQSMSMLSLNSTYILTSIAAFVSSIYSVTYNNLIIHSILVILVVGFLVSALFCFLAMRKAHIGLPGRVAGYWKWAIEQKISKEETIDRYLKAAEVQYDAVLNVSNKASLMLDKARMALIITPFGTAAIGLLVYWLGHLTNKGINLRLAALVPAF